MNPDPIWHISDTCKIPGSEHLSEMMEKCYFPSN